MTTSITTSQLQNAAATLGVDPVFKAFAIVIGQLTNILIEALPNTFKTTEIKDWITLMNSDAYWQSDSNNFSFGSKFNDLSISANMIQYYNELSNELIMLEQAYRIDLPKEISDKKSFIAADLIKGVNDVKLVVDELKQELYEKSADNIKDKVSEIHQSVVDKSGGSLKPMTTAVNAIKDDIEKADGLKDQVQAIKDETTVTNEKLGAASKTDTIHTMIKEAKDTTTDVSTRATDILEMLYQMITGEATSATTGDNKLGQNLNFATIPKHKFHTLLEIEQDLVNSMLLDSSDMKIAMDAKDQTVVDQYKDQTFSTLADLKVHTDKFKNLNNTDLEQIKNLDLGSQTSGTAHSFETLLQEILGGELGTDSKGDKIKFMTLMDAANDIEEILYQVITGRSTNGTPQNLQLGENFHHINNGADISSIDFHTLSQIHGGIDNAVATLSSVVNQAGRVSTSSAGGVVTSSSAPSITLIDWFDGYASIDYNI